MEKSFTITLPRKADDTLQRICPDYLKGKNGLNRRVLWAIDELVARLEDAGERASKSDAT